MNLKSFIASHFRAWLSPRGGTLSGLVLAILWGVVAPSARAALQFDVFLGYDGLVRELNWFPVVFEVFNDGPSFKGVIEFGGGQFGGGQMRRIADEFPTNTRKRYVMPAFASSRSSIWNARLVDERGKVRSEQPNLRAKMDLTSRSYLLGGLPRTFGGLPTFPDLNQRPLESKPVVGHMRPELFPDNPLTLEAVDAIYLNSEKALELKAPQVNALLRWLHQGGHLLVAVEQPADILGTPWLRALMPIDLSNVATQSLGNEVLHWIRQAGAEEAVNARTASRPDAPTPAAMSPAMRRRHGLSPLPQASRAAAAAPAENPWTSLPVDSGWEDPVVGIATGALRDGKVLLAMGQTPLVVNAARDRGQITVILFNPEREPFRTWKVKPWLWARLAQIPWEQVQNTKFGNYGGLSIDGVLGAMIDSKQVRKLPISWLLGLLVVYLAVIGPVDQFVLKKLNKQMWTWVTFPVYVVAFSFLIYFISFKLRHGETELNELHFVDVFPAHGKAEMRGRTFLSIYSPANARFQLRGEQPFACLRGESTGPYSAGIDGSRAEIDQQGYNYRADVYVPVWTSQLFVNDWWQDGPLPLSAGLIQRNGQYQLQITNLTGRPLTEARLVFKGRVYAVGGLAPGAPLTFSLGTQPAISLQEFMTQYGGQQFQMAANERRQAFSGNPRTQQWNLALSAMAVSFLNHPGSASLYSPDGYSSFFLTPAGLDISGLSERDEAVLLVWDAGHSLARPTNQFQPRRRQQDTLLRLVVSLRNEP